MAAEPLERTPDSRPEQPDTNLRRDYFSPGKDHQVTPLTLSRQHTELTPTLIHDKPFGRN